MEGLQQLSLTFQMPTPLPADKNEIAVCTAMAGEMLGMGLIYMDAGSGAKRPVSESMIEKVAQIDDVIIYKVMKAETK